MIERIGEILGQLRQRRAVRFLFGYLVAAWVGAQIVGFFVEQGYTTRRILDITLFLLLVGFFAALTLIWYHGERGRQRPRRSEIVFLAAIALTATAGVAWLATRDAVSRVAAGEVLVELGDSSLAVLPFVNELQDPELAWLDRGVSELLATNLAQLRHLRVVSGQRLFDLLRQLGEDDARAVPEDLQAVVTRRAGARYLLSGRLASAGSDLVLIATLIDAETGEIAGAARAQGPDVFALVDRVSAGVLPPELAAGASPRPVAQLTTRSLEAYAEFQKGHEARLRLLMPDAERHFRAAIALDSTFALAHFQLAGVQAAGGDIPGAMVSLRRARLHLPSANERDRLFIEGLGSLIEGDLDRGEATLSELLRRYPDDKEARLVLANFLRRSRRDPDLAQRLLEEALRLDPFYGPAYNMLAYYAAGRGDFDSANVLIDRYVELGPDEPNPIDSRGEILELAGRFEEARDAYRAALGLRPDFTVALRHLTRAWLKEGRVDDALEEIRGYAASPNPATRVIARQMMGDAYFWDGRLAEGLEAYEGAAAEAEAADRTGLRINALRGLMFAALQLGRYRAALEASEVLDRVATAEGASFLARILAGGERGQLEEVRSAIADFESRFAEDPNVQPFLGAIRSTFAAYLAFYAGEHERVVELASAAPFAEEGGRTEYLGFPVLRSLLALGLGEEAVEQVGVARRAGAALTGVTGQFDPVIERLLRYFEGRALELSGDHAGAAAAYDEVLGAWGEAVASVPLLADLVERRAALPDSSTARP